MWVIFLLQKIYKIVDPSLITSKHLHACPADSSDGLFKQVRFCIITWYNVSFDFISVSFLFISDRYREKQNQFFVLFWLMRVAIFPLSSFFFLLGSSLALDKLNTIIPTNKNNFMLTSPFPSVMWMIEKEMMRFTYDAILLPNFQTNPPIAAMK